MRWNRAIAVDFNGYTYLCDGFLDTTVAVDENPPNPIQTGMKAYPNPATELLTLELPDVLVFYEDLHFFNLCGREIKDIRYYKKPSSGREVTIDVSTFPIGVYYAIYKTRYRVEQIPFVVIR